MDTLLENDSETVGFASDLVLVLCEPASARITIHGFRGDSEVNKHRSFIGNGILVQSSGSDSSIDINSIT